MGVLSSLLILVLMAPAPEGTPAAAPDLVVSGSYWGRVVSKTIVDERGSLITTRDPWDPPPARVRRRSGVPPVTLIRRETYMLVRNVGKRTVKSIKWGFVFYADAKHERQVKRYEFRSKETVKPGEMKFISEQVNEAAPTSYGVVFIESINFEDGTTRRAQSP